MLKGLMQDVPLMISSAIEYARVVHASQPFVTRTVEGPIERSTYGEVAGRVSQLAHALGGLGVNPSDRIATIAWNTQRHFELYYAISGIGAVCHTMNPRLFAEQVVYVVNHASDRYIFVDLTFVPLVEALFDKLPGVEGYVIMTDAEHMPADSKLPNLICYEDLIAGKPETYEWPVFDENAASVMCYTSGTTGNPKGVVYSHRSTMLHSLFVLSSGEIRVSQHEVILPVVPLFHVSSWGLPYAAAISGAGLVMPGSGLDGASLFDLMEEADVTSSWGVPTVWIGLLAEMDKRGRKPSKLSNVVVGGTAPPESMIDAFERRYGINFIHGWGMTETSPVGTLGILPPDADELSLDERVKMKVKQGRRLFGLDYRLVDDDGNHLPHDGKAVGELLIKGATIAGAYFEDEEATEKGFTDGWLRTGDLANIDTRGFLTIVDRAKDLVKSGGEWISSVDLENAAMGHPGVMEAAVIGIPHPKWDERPLLIVVKKEGHDVTGDDIKEFLAAKVAKWWLPDAVVFVDELPHSATGKLLKMSLREQYGDFELPTE
jgi:acyl-CoA synthetase (AMP-forming)/AMP-acid ligase II